MSEMLGLAGSSEERTVIRSCVEEPLLTGNSFFDAEDAIFLDRFLISNKEPRLYLGPLYLPECVGTGAAFHIAVRVRNVGPFTVSSTAQNPVFLSYHWLRSGEVVEFEGYRSHLPLDLAPGQEVTAHLLIQPAPGLGPLTLQVLPMQEMHRWMDEGAIEGNIFVTNAELSALPDHSSGREFSAALEDELAVALMDAFIQPDASSIAIEIGGALQPSFRNSKVGATWPGIFVNADVSTRLLKIAHLLARPRAFPTMHARLDANNLPVSNSSVDVVVFSRAIHHFEDLNVILREVHRVLKPGGQLFLLCEPIASQYDAYILSLIRDGVNEQVFPPGIYRKLGIDNGFLVRSEQADFGYSYKAYFQKA